MNIIYLYDSKWYLNKYEKMFEAYTKFSLLFGRIFKREQYKKIEKNKRKMQKKLQKKGGKKRKKRKRCRTEMIIELCCVLDVIKTSPVERL